MDAATSQFTDRMGLLFEAEGRPRIAGRIFGYLLLSDDPRSLDQLADSLRVSKASASTNARLLADQGVLERVCLPADRHDYYHVAPDLFARTMAERMRRWAAGCERLLALSGSGSPRRSGRRGARSRSGASGSRRGSGATRRPTHTWWRRSERRWGAGSGVPSAAG